MNLTLGSPLKTMGAPFTLMEAVNGNDAPESTLSATGFGPMMAEEAGVANRDWWLGSNGVNHPFALFGNVMVKLSTGPPELATKVTLSPTVS